MLYSSITDRSISIWSILPAHLPVLILADFTLNDSKLGPDDRDNPKDARLGGDQSSLLVMLTSRWHCFAVGDYSSTLEGSGVIVNKYWICCERVAVKMRNNQRI